MNKELLSYLKKILIKTVLHVFWIFPIEKNKIFLMNELSFTFGDSLKYFDIYLHKMRKNKYKIVFPIKDGSIPSDYVDDIIVKPMSIKYFKELISSGIIITNAGGVSYLPKKKHKKSLLHGMEADHTKKPVRMCIMIYGIKNRRR